jgi:hypothetical protein
MTKIPGSGSGSICQRHGSSDPDPDPHQNVMDPQHCILRSIIHCFGSGSAWIRIDFGRLAPDPDPDGQNEPQNTEKSFKFEVLDVLF